LRSSRSLIDAAIPRDAPNKDDLDLFPRLAANAAPAAFCCFFDFAGMPSVRAKFSDSAMGTFPGVLARLSALAGLCAMLVHPAQCVVEVEELAFELRFVSFLEQSAHLRTCLHSKFQQVAAK
jgi:hypothetical protein